MTAKIEEVRDAPTRISSNEAVVLLAKPHLEGTGTEDKFLDCLERELVGEAFSSDHAAARKKGKADAAADAAAPAAAAPGAAAPAPAPKEATR